MAEQKRTDLYYTLPSTHKIQGLTCEPRDTYTPDEVDVLFAVAVLFECGFITPTFIIDKMSLDMLTTLVGHWVWYGNYDNPPTLRITKIPPEYLNLNQR